MAKGKHSVALFEVISAGKTSSRSSSLSTPKWWFKKGKPDAPAAPPPKPEPELETTAPAPRTPGVDLKLDGDGQRIKFNMSYNSAIVAGFTVVVVVGLAYLIGTRMSRGPTPAVAAGSTEQVRSGPVNRGVLEIATVAAAPAPAPAPAVVSKPVENIQPPPSNDPPLPAANTASQRTIGLNYVVVQSYPTEQMAIDVRELLGQNGIPTTVEKGLKDFGPANLFYVVGLKGFDRPKSDPAYKAYLDSIIAVQAKVIKNPKFTKFDPSPYSWKAQPAR